MTTTFLRGDQIAQAARRGHVKTPPGGIQPHEAYSKALRNLVVQVVYAFWNENRKPMHLTEQPSIFEAVTNLVDDAVRYRRWPWEKPLKRTVDRRVNECAQTRLWEVPPLIGTGNGWYMPNPARFEEPARSELIAISQDLRNQE